MPSIAETLKSRSFLLGMGGIFIFQLVVLLFTTPMYDIDTNSFITGGLSWDVYHNPFENIFIGIFSKISGNASFLVSLQLLFYSFAASFFIHVILGNGKWCKAGLIIAAIEPVGLFYHFHLLPESFYTSFLLLTSAFMVRWMRETKPSDAIGFGAALGFAFLCKLTAVVHLVLFVLFLFRSGTKWKTRLTSLGYSMIPFAACYLFVSLGQQWINKGQLYTVAGRVRWDFANSQYDPAHSPSAAFSQFVDHYIVVNGKLIADRELRRELSYLGYKDCVEENELKGKSHNASVACCDSIFDVVGSQLIKDHFQDVLWQFVKDNLYAVHHLNYLDYRHTPGLPFYHAEGEWNYIDSVMETHFSVNLAKQAGKIPVIWRDLRFTNIYIPILWWAMWAALITIFILVVTSLFQAGKWDSLYHLIVIGVMIAVPIAFHVVYISYRPRFLAPYFLQGIVLCIALVDYAFTRRSSSR